MEYISASLIEVFASDLLLIRRMGLQNADAVEWSKFTSYQIPGGGWQSN